MRRCKIGAQLVVLLALTAVLLAGCGGDTEPQAKPDMTEAVQSAVNEGCQWLVEQVYGQPYVSDHDEAMFLLERAGRLSAETGDAYLLSLAEAVEYGNDFDQVTQWQRIAFAVAASGGDPTDQAGLDFLSMVLSYDVTDENNYVDLYVLDSKLLASGAFGQTVNDQDVVLAQLLAMQNEEGAFVDQWGTTVDSTSLTLQALAASGRAGEEPVKSAVDRAVAYLGTQQGNDGSMSFDGAPSLTSTGQAVAALASLGIDPASDSAFIKEGHSLAEALLTLYETELAAEQRDYYSMTQGLMGLVAYQRLLDKEPGYFAAGMYAADGQAQEETALGQSSVDSANAVTVSIASDEAVMAAPAAVALEENDTAYSVLKRLCREQGIALEVSGSGRRIYVEGIGDLYERDKGASSGWMYRLNGEYPQKSAGSCPVAAGDTVEWLYSLDAGGAGQ